MGRTAAGYATNVRQNSLSGPRERSRVCAKLLDESLAEGLVARGRKAGIDRKRPLGHVLYENGLRDKCNIFDQVRRARLSRWRSRRSCESPCDMAELSHNWPPAAGAQAPAASSVTPILYAIPCDKCDSLVLIWNCPGIMLMERVGLDEET